MGVSDVAKDCRKTIARKKVVDSANVLLHEACIQQVLGMATYTSTTTILQRARVHSILAAAVIATVSISS